MKRTLKILLALVAALTVNSQWSAICALTINGVACPTDTLEHYQVGAGTMYTRFNVTISGTTHRLYLLSVDLTNPYVKIEEEQAKDRMGATELLTSVHQRIDSLRHHPVGGVNCNFWVVASQAVGTSEGLLGQPFAGTARDGVLIGEPESWNSGHGDRGFVMIDEMNRALIRNMEYKGRVCKGDASAAIRDVNRNRVNPNGNEIALFNRYCGATTRAIADTVVEVVFEAVNGWAINDSMKCVVLSRNTTGGTALTGNMGALQGRGARGDWCRNNLAVGDTFKIKLGMYSKSITSDDNVSGDSIAPHVMQMVTGNCLVMANGVLTSRNTNEDYNNRNYPRTMLATNNEGDHFWMLVSEKPGNYTAEMCEMLREAGATWAAGMDGGGSAQMELFGSILNPTTEATPRAVANSLFVINTAPESDQVTRIELIPSEPQTVSAYAAYTPALRMYNEYGTLLPAATPYSLSAEPANLGTISEDGHSFVAGPLAGDGVLTVTAGSATFNIPLTVEAGEMHLRLDSVLLDHHPYTLEVLTGTALVPADIFSWISEDEEVAIVENGVARGIANGTTTLIGTMGDIVLEKQVKVQIPLANHIFDNAFDTYILDAATLEASKDFAPTIAVETVGEDCTTGSAHSIYQLSFDYSVVRAAFVRMLADFPLYAIPDSIAFNVKTDAVLSKLRIYGRANDAPDKAIYQQDNFPKDTWQRVVFPMSSWLSAPSDQAAYPVHFVGFELSLDSKTTVGSHAFSFSTPELIYNDPQTPSSIDSVESQNHTPAGLVLIDGQLFIQRDGHYYTALGQLIH